MTDHDAFLDAIRENPDDDAHRLVYADWLEERGDPRGEFIRVQCELARLPKSNRRRAKLEAREEELLKKRRAEWTRPLRAIVGDLGFERGLVTWATAKARKFLDHADALFCLAPIQHLRLNDSKAHIKELAVCSALKHLRTLSLESNAIGGTRAAILLASRHLANVTALILNHNHIGVAGARALAVSPHLGRLTRLAAVGNNLNDTAIKLIAEAPGLTGLRQLYLANNTFTAAGLECLVNSPVAVGLRTLTLGSNPSIREQAAPILIASPHLQKLECLEIPGQPPRLQRLLLARFGRSVCRSPFFPSFDHLEWRP
jgi:uncharacterized protein (TIGR02996 family)